MNTFTMTANCIVCGNNQKEILLDLSFLKELQASMSLVSCVQCGFEYIDPHLTASVAKDFYNEEYFQNNYLNYEDQRLQQFELLHKRLIKHGIIASGNSLNVLDIGAGAGYFLKLIKDKYDANIYGVEPSLFARNYAKKRFGVECFQDISKLQDTAFDLITFWDVIGHVNNPVDYLTFCREHIKDQGYLVIKFPNFGSSWHRFNFFLSKWRHVNSIHVPTIIWRFSKATISRFLDRFGFTIEMVETIKQPLLGSVLSWKLKSVRFLTTMIDEITNNRQEIIFYARKK